MKRNGLLILLLLAVTFSIVSPMPASADEMTIAIIPQMPISEIYERWRPLLKKLTEQTGIEFKILGYTSVKQFEEDVFKGNPDVVYMNPMLAMKARAKSGYVPLVRDKSELIGILVTKKGSGVNSVGDLNGKTIAFPDPNAFAASLYMRMLLSEKEKIKFKPEYVRTHNNVYRNIILDKAQAGGGVMRTLMKEHKDVQESLVVIYETPGTAAHPIAIHPRVSAQMQKKIKDTILRLSNDMSNKKLFEKITMPDPIAADFDRDYLPLKKIEATLEKYMVSE